MNATLVPGAELSSTQQQRWREIQASVPEFASPCLGPDFTQAVAAVRDDVEVAVIESEGRIVGFFAFERKRFGCGAPVGGRLSDFQAVVCEPGFEWDAHELLRACELKLWDFDHLLASQRPFSAYHRGVDDSPTIALSGGFDAYREDLRERGSKVVAKMERYARKLEEKLGPIRFVAEDESEAALAFVIARKSAQCKRTGTFDFFALDWTVKLVQDIHRTRSENFAGRLSTLYVGDDLVAAHMGMRSRNVWHWWFPVYDDGYAVHSPGGILLLRAIEQACTEGIGRIDLGKGGDLYKQRFMNGATSVAQGHVGLPSMPSLARSAQLRSEHFLRKSALAKIVREPIRAIRQRLRAARDSSK